MNEYGIDFKSGTKLMGVVNVTPDSFYDGGKYSNTVDDAVNHALKLVKEGADIIDIGGESSRPGAKPVTTDEEINRILPVIEKLRQQSNIPISVDTYKPDVAENAIKAGADWINDITGLDENEKMIKVVADHQCPVIVMHMQGNPQSMQENPVYENVVEDIKVFFRKKISLLKQTGINKIILDPGIGFGKTVRHNLEILNKVSEFKQLGYPVLIGASRKSFIGKILKEDVENRLIGSISVLNWLYFRQVDLVRVHDVKESRQSLQILSEIILANN